MLRVRLASDGRRRDLTAAPRGFATGGAIRSEHGPEWRVPEAAGYILPRMVTEQSLTGEPRRHVLGPWRADDDPAVLRQRLANMEAERDLARGDALRMEVDRDDALTENQRLRTELAEAQGVGRASERYAKDQWERANRAEAALAVAGDELRTAHAEVRRLRGGLHGLANGWDADALNEARRERPAHDWPSAVLHPHARAVRALLNETPQETHQ